MNVARKAFLALQAWLHDSCRQMLHSGTEHSKNCCPVCFRSEKRGAAVLDLGLDAVPSRAWGQELVLLSPVPPGPAATGCSWPRAEAESREGHKKSTKNASCPSSEGHSSRAGLRNQPSGAAPWEPFCCRNIAISFLVLILATERVWLLGRFLIRRLGLLKPPGFFFSLS